MTPFSDIWAKAAERKGGDAALEALLAGHASKSPAELAVVGDDRWLAMMTRCVFQAGFAWKVIEAKWDGFEAAFHGFAVPINAAMSEEEFDAHLKDTRIVRNGAKIAAVRDNARFLLELAAVHGSGAAFFAAWPDADFAGLLEVMKRRAARLSGETAMPLFRWMGKPAYITTRDVSAALVESGVLERPPSGKRDLERVQAAFNAWSAETGRDLTALSRVLAMSAGPNALP
jgi:3-methyladenine DNA glycosylase Tag